MQDIRHSEETYLIMTLCLEVERLVLLVFGSAQKRDIQATCLIFVRLVGRGCLSYLALLSRCMPI